MRDFKTVTVGELMQLLSDYDPETPVIVTANYGDRCRTQQALPLSGEAEETQITQSAYSDSGYAIGEPDEDEDDGEMFLVIR